MLTDGRARKMEPGGKPVSYGAVRPLPLPLHKGGNG
jgi:hypothetical protein